MNKILLAAALLSMSATVAADDDNLLPVEQKSGDIRYLSGGVGSDEAIFMRSRRAHYSLTLTFAVQVNTTGYYTAGTHLTVTAADGKKVLDTTSDGPFLWIDLPAGDYSLTAELAGEQQSETRKVSIKPGAHSDLVIRWSRKGPHEPGPTGSAAAKPAAAPAEPQAESPAAAPPAAEAPAAVTPAPAAAETPAAESAQPAPAEPAVERPPPGH